jgi:hypothetical protein
MPFILIGLPLVLFGAFSRTYTIPRLGSCFFIDVVSWGPFCFEVGSSLPDIAVYGAHAAGLALVVFGFIQTRRVRRAQQQPSDAGSMG